MNIRWTRSGTDSFLGPEGQGTQRRFNYLSRALIHMRDWCASDRRETQRKRNHGRTYPRRDLQSNGKAAANRIEFSWRPEVLH
jgi:hypothetical protein